jgi:hypothetical protein
MDVKEALKMYEDYQQGWDEIYKKAKNDLEFYIGNDHDQWDKAAYLSRTSLGRPCLTVNVLPQFVHQVTNQIRMNTPTINVIPSDVESSEETAKIQKGLIRKIEYNSGADEIYDTAAGYAVVASIGFIRVNHDYVVSDSFKQHVILERVQNPLACWIDPESVECDGSDATGAIIITTISKKDFEKKYGKDKAFTSFEINEATRIESTTKDEITIAEIYVKDYETTEKQQLEDGTISDVVDDGKRGKKTRKLKKTIVRRFIFSGADKLEESIFPCKYIPLVPVYGQEIWVDGKRNLISLIRNAKDPQRRYNHWASIEAEILDKSPMAPWIADAGVTEEFPDDYTDPDNATVIRYRSRDLEGNPASPPQRVQMAGVPSGIINAMQGAYEDIKRAMGLYDASVGQKSNETSGIAIEARQAQGDVATFHFPDNLARSVAQVGRVIISMIPQIYDTAQILQIVDDEENTKFIGVNGTATEGQDLNYMLTEGQYDVRVTTGRSYSSRLQEGSLKMMDLISGNPALMGVFGDLAVRGLDIPNAEQIAERIKKTIDPKLLTEQKEGEEAPDPEKEMMTQQLQQMDAQLQEMMPIVEGKQMEAQQKQAELGIKQQEMQIKFELESQKLQLEAEKLQFERDKADAEIMSKHLTSVQEPVMTAPQEDDMQSIEILQQKLEQKMLEKQQREEQEAILAEQQYMAEMETSIREEEERAEKAAKEVREAQDRATLMEVLVSIAQGVNALAARAGQPMQVVRDENGQIVGSAPMENK